MLTSELKTSTTRIGDALVCSFAGDIHIDNEPLMRQELHRALVLHPALLAVNLSAVDLFTSTALNTLLITRSAALDLNVPLVLVAPSAQTRQVLEITETDSVFEVFLSVAEALRQVAPSTLSALQRSAPAEAHP